MGQVTINPNCSFPTSALETFDPPIFDGSLSGFLSRDILTLTVTISARYFEGNFVMTGQDNPVICGNKFLMQQNTADATNCSFLMVAQIPWSDAYPHCGIVYLNDSDAQFTKFSGQLQVTLYEDIGSIRGQPLTRTIQSVLGFIITFPKTATTTFTPLQVFSPAAPLGAVIQQFVVEANNDNPTPAGTVSLYTSLQYPFKILSTTVSTSRNDLNVSIGPDPTSTLPCNDVGITLTGPICQQLFVVNINVLSIGVCNFDGSYVVNLTLVCEASYGVSCPISLNLATGLRQAFAQITFTLDTENFCPTALADIGLTATVQSFQDPSHNIVKNDFFLGQTSYDTVTVASPQATIVQTSISSIVLLPNTVLYSNGTFFLNQINLHIQEFPPIGNQPSTNPVQAFFDFLLTANPFSPPADSSVTQSLQVTVNVVFINTAPQGQKTGQLFAAFKKQYRASTFSFILPKRGVVSLLDASTSQQEGIDAYQTFVVSPGQSSGVLVLPSPISVLLVLVAIALIRF